MRNEFEIKVKGTLDLSRLLAMGAEPLGKVSQQDIYLAGDYNMRIRKEAGHFLLTEKKRDIGKQARIKEVSEKIISESEADNLIKKIGVRVTVCKNRNIFHTDKAVIAIDEVEHLGKFVEVSASNESDLFYALDMLGIDKNEGIKESYLDMMLAKSFPPWFLRILRFHEKVGELSFGITSGILTTVGVLVGVNAATSSRLSVIAAIAAIAIADSLSDSFGMYMSKNAERGSDSKSAFRYAAGTFIGKLILPLTFMIPIFIFSLEIGVFADIIWGAIALAILSAEQAVVSQKSILKIICRNLGIAALIVVFSAIVGTFLSYLEIKK